MNKASVSKKTLSVLLSVLMVLSCCVTAFPWLADTFGLTASAAVNPVSNANKTALINALNTYSSLYSAGNTDRTANAKFHVAEALTPVLADLAYSPSSFTTVTVGTECGDYTHSESWGDQTAPFMGDLRTWVLNNCCANTTQQNLIYELIPYFGGNASNETYTPQNQLAHILFGDAWEVGSNANYSNYYQLSAISDVVVTVSRSVKQAMYDYATYTDLKNNMPNTINTTYTITYHTALYQTGDQARIVAGVRYSTVEYYYFAQDPSGAYGGNSTNNAKPTKDDLTAYMDYFNSARLQQDPFTAFANLSEAQTEVNNNNAKYNAFWSNSGRWSTSDNKDILLLNYFGGQYTTIAGEPCGSTAFTNAVPIYMEACVDTLNYYKCKPYAQDIGQYSLPSGTHALDRDRLSFYRNPATNEIEDPFDLTYMTKMQAQTIWTNIRNWLNFIEGIYGSVDGNVTDNSATKGLKKLFSVDGYYHTDVVNLLTLLEDYYEYYDLVQLKEIIDGYITEYQVPTEDHVDLTAGTYRFRDNDPDSETFVSDSQIEILLGLFNGYVTTLTSDDTYSRKLKFYVFGNANFDEDPDIAYIETVRDYLSYEASRRGFVMELAPFIAHFTPLIYMNLGSLTVTQLQNRILEDQALYEKVYDYTFTDREGNQLYDNQSRPVTPALLGYGDTGTYGPYNYINVYRKYYNTANHGEFTANPLARADFLELLGTFNEDVQIYIEKLYKQLAFVLATRITDAMNVTNDADSSLEITLSNFSVIKTMLERVTKFFTILAEPTYDENDNQTGVYMFNYLKYSSYMYKQTQTASDNHLTGEFTNQQLNLINLNIHTELGNDYSLETAYNMLMNCGLLAKVQEFVNQGGLANWEQIHYYNTDDGTADTGYKFTRPEAYMVRLPYAGDLGRGNDTQNNDTYTVTNKMMNDLVAQLDTFLGSNDMVAILSNFIKDGETSSLITGLTTKEYVMKLLGEKLFTDNIVNTLTNLIFPMLIGMLEDLWNGLDGREFDTNSVGKFKLYTRKSIYSIANSLGLSVYPDKLANLISGSDTQLATAKAQLSDTTIINGDEYRRVVNWTNLRNKYPYVDPETGEADPEKLGINWGIDSYTYEAYAATDTTPTYDEWFSARATRFEHALAAVLGGLDELLRVVMTNHTYSQPNEVSSVINLDGTSGLLNIINVTPGLEGIHIEGAEGYSKILAPVLEALGCSDNDILTRSQANSQLTSTQAIVHALINPLANLIKNQVAVAPIATILNLLPNLLYFVSFNTIDQLLQDLTLHVYGAKVDTGVLGITLRLSWILEVAGLDVPGLSWECRGKFLGLFSDPNDVYANIYGLIGGNINSLIKDIDISDINDILDKVLKGVLKDQGDLELPVVDVGSVLARTQLYETVNTATGSHPARPYIATKAIKNDGSTYNRRYFIADKADMFYDIVSWVGSAFHNDSFINQLVAIITKSNQEQDVLVTELLTGVKNAGPAHFVMGLVEVFQPKARAGVASTSVWANTTYMPAQYTWYGADSAENGMQNLGVSSFLYVAYQNDWTYIKANTFVENADTIITKLLEQQLREREVNSFGEWLLSLINLAWSNVAISTVMNLLVTLGNATKNELVSYIISRFTEYGMDLSEWYDAFGHLFPDVVNEAVPTGEVDENDQPITVPQMPAQLDPADPNYTNVFPKLTYAPNPDYEPDPNESGVDRNRFQKYIWSYEGHPLVDGDRETFQEILSYMLAGGDGTNGGMMPAIDIFLSGDLGVLFPQTNGTSLLKVYGSNGYDSALVPFFEALGMNELLSAEDFKGFAVSVGLNPSTDFATGRHMLKQSEFDSIATEQLKVEYLFNVAFGFLEKIMEPEYTEQLDDEGHVVLDEVTGEPVMVPVYNKLVKDILTTILPTSLYFLQSNGLSVMIRNLLQPVLTLVDALLPMFNYNIDGTGTPLNDLLDELIGRFVLPLLGKAGDREIVRDPVTGDFLYETDTNGEPKRDKDGNVMYIYKDDYGVTLKDLSLHKIASLAEKLLGLNMEPFVYGLDAICASVVGRSSFVDSASEMSTDAFWTTSGARNSFKKPVFLNGSYYNIVNGQISGGAQDVNDPANVATILVSLVLDLALCEKSKSPVKTPVLGADNKPVYLVDQNGNTTTMIDYTYTVVDGVQQYYSNAEALVNLIKVFTDSELVDLIPMVLKAIRELGFTAAWNITPNWSYFDDIDRAEYDPETGELIRTNRRTTAQLIAEATAMNDITGRYLINTPVRTIYYLRYAENFGTPVTNLWSRELATYLDTSLSDLVNWIMAEFVVKQDGATLGGYLEDLLTGEDGFINKGIINTVNAALRDSIGGAVAQFSELLNIFLSFDIHYWDEDPYPEAEEDDPISLTQFGTDLARLFTPLNEVLTWLLSGKDMAMFHSYQTTGGYTEYVMDEADRVSDYGDLKDLIVLPGGQGYWVALVPLLEALGIELPMVGEGDARTPKYLRESEGQYAGRIYYMEDGEKVWADGITILTDVVVAVVSQVDGWLHGVDPLGLGDNVIDCVLNRLANVIYFLNANGLVTIVINLLSPLLPLANAIVPLIFSDLGVPEQGPDEDDAAYETRKFIVLVDELLDALLYNVYVDDNGDPILVHIDPATGKPVVDDDGVPIPYADGVEYHIPILPPSFSIVDLNLYNICEVIKDITGLDINGAVTADFYVNGENGNDGTAVKYNWLKNFFLGEISMRSSANGDKYFRMDFTDEESRADFITILLYTAMDIVNNAVTPGTSNNRFFVNVLGKTKDENDNEIVDEALGQQKLNDLYNIIHAKVSGYEGYDWFYFNSDVRSFYYTRTPENETPATMQLLIASLVEQIGSGSYQVDWNDTTMKYLLTGYLNYTDTNLWDEGTARQVEARFNEIVTLAVRSFLGDDATLGGYLTEQLEGLELYSNKYIVMLGAMLGNLLKGIPENVASLLSAAVPGFDATYWNQYAGKAVEDADHPAGTFDFDEETGEPVTEYVPLVLYTSKTEFVDAFVALFEPFGYLLDWLLVGEHKGLELFYIVEDDETSEHYGLNDEAAISIGGANGFKEGLVPLLEALGMHFNAAEVNDPNLTGIQCIRLTLLSLLTWAEDLLAQDDVVGAVVNLLPNIIYFINANGLTVTVLNTLRSLTNILELASGLLKNSENDITNLNTLLNLGRYGVDIYDLSFEGICNIVKANTGLDILKGVSLPLRDADNNIVLDDQGHVVYQPSYLQQWAIGKVSVNTASALYPERTTYRMDFTYTPEEIAAFGEDWSGITVEERARRMERINIFTILVCSVLDVFKLEENEETLRGWLGDYYDLIWDILHLTAHDINYDEFDWFYFDETIYGNVNADPVENPAAYGNWDAFFPADGSEFVVKYLDTTPYSLIYKYGYFEYYRRSAGETGNLWNKDSVGYLKTNFYTLIDTVIKMAVKREDDTPYNSAAEFISEAWSGLNLYSTENLYKVGSTIGNALSTFEGVLALALNIVLGVDITGHWDEYLSHRVTNDAALVGTEVKDDDDNVVTYKDVPVTYILNESMSRTAFISDLVDIFEPADFLVSWFLVGADTPLEFMYTKTGEAAIKLNGGNGYDEALVPILEALGCDLSDSAAYFAAAEGGKSGINVVKYVADKLLGRVDAIAASANPVQEIVAMLPNLIYFINVNGLSVAVRNFLQPVISLLGIVNSFVDTGDIGEIETIDDLFAFAMNMLSGTLNVDFDLTALSINDLSITGVFNIVKVITDDPETEAIDGIDLNTAMTFPRVTNDDDGNTVIYINPDTGAPEYINIWETLAIGKVTRFTSANGRTAFRMDACDDEAALSQIDMIAVLMATVVNLFDAKAADNTYLNEKAFIRLVNGFAKEGQEPQGEAIWNAIVKILHLQSGSYVDYNWLFTLRTEVENYPYLDPQYQNVYVSPIDRMSAITGTAGYDRYWTKEMAQYVADNLIKVVNNVLLLIGISIPGIDGPIESIDDLINGLIPGGSLYTNELLGKLVALIVGTGETNEENVVDTGLIGKLDDIDGSEAIKGLLKNVLGIDLDGMALEYRGRTNFGFVDGDRNGFVDALAEFLSPLNPLLEWLFTDQSISLFYNYDASDLIKLPGGNGYEQAIIPLFEAVIGYDNPNIKTLAEYKADIVANKKYILVDILNPLLDFVDAALADPLNVILGRIPAIVYFINSEAADRMLKNLLSPVYQVLNALNTLVDVNIDSLIEGAIGTSLRDLDFNAIIELVIGMLPENLSSLSPLIVDAVKEFTIGKVIQYPSHATFYTGVSHEVTDAHDNVTVVPYTYTYGFTMELDHSSSSSGGGVTVYGSENATLADLITILLRALIKWLTMPENQQNVVEFLNNNIENEQVRTYVLNAYGVDATTLGAIDTGLIGFRYQPYGTSMMMALLYYVYFAANFASSAAVDAVRNYGNYWPYVASVLTNESLNGVVDLSFLSGFITYLNGLVERVNGQSGNGGSGDDNGNTGYTPTTEDNDSGTPADVGTVVEQINNNSGNSMNFFQRIIAWFQNLFSRIAHLFGR